MRKNEDNKQPNSSFLYSINHATKEDILPKAEDEPHRESNLSEIIRKIFFVIFVCIIVLSLYSIFDTLSGYRKAEDFYDNMHTALDSGYNESAVAFSSRIASLDPFSVSNGAGKTQMQAYNELFARMRARIRSIQTINKDVFAWIVVPGTDNIDYPVLQGVDNDYYLDHEYNHGYLQAGSIFADYHCDRDTNGNFNTVIYGHNMQNGLMFSELIKFMDEEFFRNNEYVYLYTEKGMFTYRIFSAYKTDYKYKYIETGFPSAADFVDFAYEMKANSLYERDGVEFNENDRILTLSTCTNGTWSDRYCVQAVLINSYNSPD